MSSFPAIPRYIPLVLTITATAFFIYTMEKYRPEPASMRYKECLTQAKEHPDIALHTARAWEQENPSSAAARHCEAVALYEIKQYPEAAKILEDLAHQGAKSTPDLSVTLLTQAANARSLSKESLLAIQDLDYALTLSPNNPMVKALQAELTKK